MPGPINYEAMRMTPDSIRSDTSKCDETRQATLFHGCLRSVTNYQYIKYIGEDNFHSLINNREVNIINTVLFSINSKSEGCQEMAAETEMERGRIRL